MDVGTLGDVDKLRACITDLGSAIFTTRQDFMQNAAGQRAMTLRWAAPEVLIGENPTQESDVFSFAMIMIKVRHG